MRPALLDFERSIDDLERLLSRSRVEEQLLAQDPSQVMPLEFRETLVKFREAAEPFAVRQANYSMQLVLLYGAFERFIENLASSVIAFLNEAVPKVDLLPTRIVENHRRKTIDALRDEVWLSRQSDPTLARQLIENLQSVESKAGNFKLNERAYSRHPGNFRQSSIDETFRDLAVEDLVKSVGDDFAFKRYLESLQSSSISLEDPMSTVDDLAERRNEIAHGSPGQLLGADALGQYLEFFRIFARSAYYSLRRKLAIHLVASYSSNLGAISAVNYKTICPVDFGSLPEGTRIELGDPLAMSLDSEGTIYELGTIKTLRTLGGDVTQLRTHQGLTVSVETSIRLRVGRHLHLLDRDSPGIHLATSSYLP